MKRLMIFILSIFLFVSCNIEHHSGNESVSDAQRHFNNCIRENHIKNEEGHDVILYEVGWCGSRNYSFSIDHDPMCKKCLDFYE